jgi:ribonuclease Y
VGIPAAFVAGYFIRRAIAVSKAESIEAKAEKVLAESKSKGKEIILSAQEKALGITEAAKKEDQERRQQLTRQEEHLSRREDNLDSKFNQLEKKRSEIEAEVKKIRQTKKDLQALRKKQMENLEKIAGLKKDDARGVLLDMVEKDMKEDLLARIKKIKAKEAEEVEKESREILAQAIQRYAGSHSAESTSTVVDLPNDELKGRIIGREGRNIRTLEQLTGVEIVVDDTPGAIVVSGFSPIRRHIAKKALENLMADGRIHPTRIEDSVRQAKEEIAKSIKEAGEAAAYELGVAGLDPKMIQLIGRLRFRSSFGQNVLQHSIEVANIATVIAEELGADVALVKKAGLLHDIGKAVDHDVQGTHVEIGRNILKKLNQPEEVIESMESHHEEFEPTRIEAHIITAADAISGARPGARKDTYDDYIKRLEEIEGVANSFEGVDKTYAIQAGREVRVFVKPENIDDLGAIKLSHEIAKRIEEDLQYPGEIKVNVIRETRAVDYAR